MKYIKSHKGLVKKKKPGQSSLTVLQACVLRSRGYSVKGLYNFSTSALHGTS